MTVKRWMSVSLDPLEGGDLRAQKVRLVPEPLASGPRSALLLPCPKSLLPAALLEWSGGWRWARTPTEPRRPPVAPGKGETSPPVLSPSSARPRPGGPARSPGLGSSCGRARGPVTFLGVNAARNLGC